MFSGKHTTHDITCMHTDSQIQKNSHPPPPHTHTHTHIVAIQLLYGRHLNDSALSQALQDLAMQVSGIRSPHTLAVVGRAQLVGQLKSFIAAAKAGRRNAIQTPLLLKHNRGGSSSGVRIFDTYESALEVHCPRDSPTHAHSLTHSLTRRSTSKALRSRFPSMAPPSSSNTCRQAQTDRQTDRQTPRT